MITSFIMRDLTSESGPVRHAIVHLTVTLPDDQQFQMRPRHFSRIAAPGQIPAPPAQSESKMLQVTEFFAPPHGP